MRTSHRRGRRSSPASGRSWEANCVAENARGPARGGHHDPRPTGGSAAGATPRAAVGVIGASGFGGALAAQLIDRHPHFELAYVTARAEAGMRLGDLHPRTRVDAVLVEPDEVLDEHVDPAIVG